MTGAMWKVCRAHSTEKSKRKQYQEMEDYSAGRVLILKQPQFRSCKVGSLDGGAAEK